jgi:hypothetical protein
LMKDLIVKNLDIHRGINKQNGQKLVLIQKRIADQFGTRIPSLLRDEGQDILKGKIKNWMNNNRCKEKREVREKELRDELGDDKYRRLTPHQFAEGL